MTTILKTPRSWNGPWFAARRLTAAAVTVCLTCAVPDADAQQFVEQTASRFPVPNPAEWTNQMTIGDLDGDGDLDLVFANGGNFSSPGTNQPARVYINDGSGVFADETLARTNNYSGLHRGVELGDIENDGDLDIVLVQDFNRRPTLLVNDGNGVFANEGLTRLPIITLSSSRAQFGDVDNDGDLDLFMTDGGPINRFGCGQYRLFINDGTGVYTDETATMFPIGNVCENMDAIFGDIDNDFDLDIRTASTGFNNSRLYVNDGSGVYTVAPTPTDSNSYSYDFADIDGDGDLDLLGANGLPGSSADILLENDGNGNYTNISSQIAPNPSLDDNDSKFFDYDNDDDLDLIIGRLGSGGERLYDNDGSGNFTQVFGVMQVITDSTLDIMVADLTGDGAYDIVTGQGESGNFQNRIYINNGPPDTLPPTIVRTEQLDDTDDNTGPYVVRALILDHMTSDRNFFDQGITLNYTVNGGPTQMSAMRYSGGQVYRGEIPGQPGGSGVEYSVTAADFNHNTTTGPTLSFQVRGTLPGDLDGDGMVDSEDLALLLGSWGPCPGCPGDLDGNGTINSADLALLLGNWS